MTAAATQPPATQPPATQGPHETREAETAAAHDAYAPRQSEAARPLAGEGPAHPTPQPEPQGSYGGIVGGETPSPFAAAVLLVGLGALIAGAVGAGTEWWVAGIVSLVAAALLAAFGGRAGPPAA